MVGIDNPRAAILEAQLHALQLSAVHAQARGRGRLDDLGGTLCRPRLELGHRGRCRAVIVTAMDQREGRGFRPQCQCPVQRRVTAAEDGQPLALEDRGIRHPVMDGLPFERVGTIEVQLARLEGAHAAGNEDRLRLEFLAGRRADQEPARLLLERYHLLAQVESRAEGLDLLHQVGNQLRAGTDRNRRDVVDRLVGIQPGALPALGGERVHDVGLDAEQAQLENLEQAAGARANDQCVGLNGHMSGKSGRCGP